MIDEERYDRWLFVGGTKDHEVMDVDGQDVGELNAMADLVSNMFVARARETGEDVSEILSVVMQATVILALKAARAPHIKILAPMVTKKFCEAQAEALGKHLKDKASEFTSEEIRGAEEILRRAAEKNGTSQAHL